MALKRKTGRTSCWKRGPGNTNISLGAQINVTDTLEGISLAIGN